MKAEAPKSLLQRTGEAAYGLFEPGLAIATGTAGAVAGGLAGLGRAALPGPSGAGADVSRKVSQALTYEPTTGIGKAATEVASYPFVKLSELGGAAGGAVTDITGSPLAGAGVSTAIQGAPIALGEIARMRAMRPEQLTPEQAATRANVAKATREGYVLTPSQADLGAVKKTLEGLTGSAKMEKLASLKNQPITNALIKEDLGIPEQVKPTSELLASMRRQEGANYEAIRGAGRITADDEFTTQINNIEAPYKRIAQDFPKSKPPAILGELEAIKEPSFSSSSAIDKIRELRDKADVAFRQGDKSLGKDLKDAANALENQIGRHLQKSANVSEKVAGTKVATPDGQPVEMYHGTTQTFKDFKEGTGWFTSSPAEANMYGGLTSAGANVRPAYINIKNPIYMDVADASPIKIAEALTRSNTDGVIVTENGKVRWAVPESPNQIVSKFEDMPANSKVPGMLEAFRQSRAKIAKLYTAEKALNSQTGNFSAPILARELKRGRPLTGGMRKVGETASAFSGSLRDVDIMRDRTEFGFGDLFLGGLGHMITGNWPALATVAARPAIRHAMLTGDASKMIPLSSFTKDVAQKRSLIPLSTLGQRNEQ